jgi:hypothetical protein
MTRVRASAGAVDGVTSAMSTALQRAVAAAVFDAGARWTVTVIADGATPHDGVPSPAAGPACVVD